MPVNILNRKIKDNEKLEVATKLAQKEEMERLQRLQETQEQVWQHAALDLRVHKWKESVLLPTTSSLLLEPPAVKSDASVVSPSTDLPASLPSSSATAGALYVDTDINIFYSGELFIFVLFIKLEFLSVLPTYT